MDNDFMLRAAIALYLISVAARIVYDFRKTQRERELRRSAEANKAPSEIEKRTAAYVAKLYNRPTG